MKEYLSIPHYKDDKTLHGEQMDFINSINNNDWTEEGCQYPNIKEGVVIKRSTLMSGQRLPMCKTKTKWWLNKLHSSYPEDMWKKLE